MTEIYAPTRRQFEEFLPNYEMIRRFELLFRMVGEDLPEAIISNTEGALSTANNALALINALAQSFGNDLAALEAKAAYASDLAENLQKQIDGIRFYIHAVNAT